MDDLERVKEDIQRARTWAARHFNAYVDEKRTPSHLLAPLTFRVTYPDVDRLEVVAMSYGEEALITTAEYRLVWKEGKVYWRGGALLRPDVVSYLEVKEV